MNIIINQERKWVMLFEKHNNKYLQNYWKDSMLNGNNY